MDIPTVGCISSASFRVYLKYLLHGIFLYIIPEKIISSLFLMKFCIACGMPMEKNEDFGRSNPSYDTCVYCTNEDGTVKSCEEIFEGGVNFFMGAIGGSRLQAEKITRKNMAALPLWKDRHFSILDGESATDEEFAEALAKLSH